MAATTGNTKTIAFLGASTGVGLAALTRALTGGHTCIALCRKPSKLTDRFPAARYPNLRVVEGNAHDVAAVSRCLYVPEEGQLVDAVVSSIGGAFIFSRMTIDDPEVCEKGAATLVEAIAKVRRQQQEENSNPAAAAWKPRVVVVSSTGLARAGRDYPLAMMPMYKFMLKVPHKDKVLMEKAVVDGSSSSSSSGYTYTIVRPSLLVDDAAPEREVRVGIDDDYVVGYTISRDDTGRWIYENLLVRDEEKTGRYENRVATVTW
ncbi:NAD(P)-binding protein [Hypoxylon rubiginosum]|uniref:NAD(P)-binding protein n=1 Tax=Hypoxylon rubiginosum TaxID=110542 RepID=A0ACB9YXY5_9PEZI|nr:NAD(P)-binding protein [Hypoxylon rubiginosum]